MNIRDSNHVLGLGSIKKNFIAFSYETWRNVSFFSPSFHYFCYVLPQTDGLLFAVHLLRALQKSKGPRIA